MNIGIRAHDFGKMPAEDLAAKVAAHGFTSIQLALAKALEGINTETGCQSPGLAYFLRDTFRKKGIRIAVLGCYINPIHPDREERKRQLVRFKEHIRFARDFGCSIVATETGSCNADFSFHPDNHSDAAFKLLQESVEEMVAEAEKFGVLVGIEPVTSHTVFSSRRMRELLDAIPSNHLQAVFDPVNLITFENHREQENIIKEAFELFGDRMVAVHAKDFGIEGGKKQWARAGTGLLNYPLLLELLKARKPYVDILLEDTRGEGTEQSRRFLQNLYHT